MNEDDEEELRFEIDDNWGGERNAYLIDEKYQDEVDKKLLGED